MIHEHNEQKIRLQSSTNEKEADFEKQLSEHEARLQTDILLAYMGFVELSIKATEYYLKSGFSTFLHAKPAPQLSMSTTTTADGLFYRSLDGSDIQAKRL